MYESVAEVMNTCVIISNELCRLSLQTFATANTSSEATVSSTKTEQASIIELKMIWTDGISIWRD